MTMTPKEYSVRLEKLFHELCPPCDLSSDGFLHHPDEALEEGFSYLVAKGIMSSGDMRQLLCEYSFGKQSLRQYLEHVDSEDVLNDLLEYLKATLKAQTTLQ